MALPHSLRIDAPLQGPAPSLSATWAGRSLSGLAILFLLADSIAKLLEVPAVIEGSAQLGYPADTVFGIGLALFLSVVVYLIPRTSLFGAILLTGYLGGAVATHVRVGNPLFTHTLFPVYMGVIIWAGLVLRAPGLRQLLPLRTGR